MEENNEPYKKLVGEKKFNKGENMVSPLQKCDVGVEPCFKPY